MGRGPEPKPLLDQVACRPVERSVAARSGDAAAGDAAAGFDGEAHLDFAAGFRAAGLARIVAVADRDAVPERLRPAARAASRTPRSEEHTSEPQSLMRSSYAVFR